MSNDEMTLTQVRDALMHHSFDFPRGSDGRALVTEMMNALTAHLAQVGEPVAEVIELEGDDGSKKYGIAFNVRLETLPLGANLYMQPRPGVEQAGEMAWNFVSIDDDGEPSVTYCSSPGAIELAVREWMGGDPDAECLSDDDEDMARGVRDELLQQGFFRPEGDPPCFLLPAQQSTTFVPDPIINLSECRARGWEDSALAYRSGWNDCRRAALGEEPLGYAGCYELATSVGVKS